MRGMRLKPFYQIIYKIIYALYKIMHLTTQFAILLKTAFVNKNHIFRMPKRIPKNQPFLLRMIPNQPNIIFSLCYYYFTTKVVHCGSVEGKTKFVSAADLRLEKSAIFAKNQPKPAKYHTFCFKIVFPP